MLLTSLEVLIMAIKTNADVALKYSKGMRSIDTEKFKAIASASKLYP